MPPLKNAKHEAFCVKYFATRDRLLSYKAAGYKGKHRDGKSTSTSADATICALLKHPNIKARLAELQERTANKTVASKARVLQEMTRIGTSDLRKILTPGGFLADPKDWDDDTAAAVAGIEIEKLFEGTGKYRKHIGYTQKVKLWDKNTSLNMLAKHHGVFADDEKGRGGDTFHLTQYNIHLPAKQIQETLPHGNGSATGNGHAGNGHTTD